MGEFAFQTLRESITSAIRSKILTGELQPGVKLAEQKLAEEFGSSRAPIREALRQLEQEGMVEYSRNVGCSVRRVKPEDVYEIYLLRANLEMTALRYFDCKFPEEDLRTLRGILEEMRNVRPGDLSQIVNKVENPSKGFPRGMITLAVMVVTCAILGTLAMSRMFDPAVINASAESFNAYVANSSYWAFQKLGQYYHVGDLFMIIYALCNVISQLAVLILSIDAPLRMLLDNEHTKQFIPQALHKVNAHGVHSNGIKMVAVLSGSIILAQSFVPGAAAVLRQLTKLNSVCMPMRYLWVFAAYIALRNAYDTIPAEYRFVKNQAVAKFFGGWCFAVTAVCCVLGMYDKDPFTFALNVITPVVLTVLGFILPALAKREQTAAKK